MKAQEINSSKFILLLSKLAPIIMPSLGVDSSYIFHWQIGASLVKFLLCPSLTRNFFLKVPVLASGTRKNHAESY